MSLDEALFERGAMYSPDRAVQKYVNEYGKREFIDGYDVGYIDGLNAAREAVKHLQHSDDCYYAEGVLCHCEIKRVITAIDALRKEPQ